MRTTPARTTPMRTCITTLILPITLALLANQSLAENRHATKMLHHMDQDGDELISIEEFRGPGKRNMFERADLDGDGIVTEQELQTHFSDRAKKHQQSQQAHMEEMQSRMSAHFARMDINDDGGVTADEARLAAFHRMDENGDGFISIDEIKPPRRRHGEHSDRQEHYRYHEG